MELIRNLSYINSKSYRLFRYLASCHGAFRPYIVAKLYLQRERMGNGRSPLSPPFSSCGKRDFGKQSLLSTQREFPRQSLPILRVPKRERGYLKTFICRKPRRVRWFGLFSFWRLQIKIVTWSFRTTSVTARPHHRSSRNWNNEPTAFVQITPK
jgi:hypothetical protein